MASNEVAQAYRSHHVHVKPGKPLTMYALPNGYESTAIRTVIQPSEEVELMDAPRDNKFVEVLYWPEGRSPERGYVDSRFLEMPKIDVAAIEAAKAASKPAEKPQTVS